MYQGNCGRCGQKVRTDENYLRAHLWASTAVFHWTCLVTLMKEHGEAALEDAAWKASRVREVEQQKLRVVAATPGAEHSRR
jgi:hypothetical protein